MQKTPFVQALFIVGERIIFLVPQLVTLVLLSRFAGREVFGEFVLIWTWAVVFQTFANFGITECLAKEIGREPEKSSLYFSHGLALAAGFAGVATLLMAPAAWAMGYPPDTTTAILVMAGTIFPTTIVGACRGALLARGRIGYLVGVAVVEAFILLPLNVYWIVTRAGLLPIIVTIVVAKTAAALLAFAIVHWCVTPTRLPLERAVLAHLWKVNWPFGVAVQAPSLRFDIFLLSKMATMGALGLYSAATKISELMLILPTAMYMAMLPQTARDLASEAPKTERLHGSLQWYFALVLPVGVGVAAFAQPIVRVVYGANFEPAAPLLQMHMVAFLVVAVDVPFLLICRAAGHQQADLKFVAAIKISNLLLNVALIPFLGGMGAAIAAVVSVGVGLVLRIWFVSRFIVRMSWSTLVLPPLFAATALGGGAVMLEPGVSWVLVALGYFASYSVVGAILFPFARKALRAAWA